MSKTMGCRPSQVYGITHTLTAYCFDAAVTRWGTSLEADLNAAGQGAKTALEAERAQARVLRRYVPATARFRDPAKE